MKNTHRILALTGVVLLLALFICPLFLTIFGKDPGYFRAAIACVIMVPILLYAFLLVLKLAKPKKSPFIDNIIFDIGDVLINFDWQGVMKNLGFSPDTISYLGENLIHDPLWKQFDKGVRPYAEITDEFCRKNPNYEKEIRTFLEHLHESVILKPYTKAWLADLKSKGYGLYVISNWPEPLYEKCKDSVLAFEKDLDGAIFSYRIHQVKPDIEIYQTLLKTYALDPARSVFLDDVQSNLDGAAKLGIHTVLVTSDHKHTLKELYNLGIK